MVTVAMAKNSNEWFYLDYDTSVGPLRFHEVKRLVRQHVIEPHTLVSKDGGEWVEARLFPEIHFVPDGWVRTVSLLGTLTLVLGILFGAGSFVSAVGGLLLYVPAKLIEEEKKKHEETREKQKDALIKQGKDSKTAERMTACVPCFCVFGVGEVFGDVANFLFISAAVSLVLSLGYIFSAYGISNRRVWGRVLTFTTTAFFFLLMIAYLVFGIIRAMNTEQADEGFELSLPYASI
jgi:hypothetical protein